MKNNLKLTIQPKETLMNKYQIPTAKELQNIFKGVDANQAKQQHLEKLKLMIAHELKKAAESKKTNTLIMFSQSDTEILEPVFQELRDKGYEVVEEMPGMILISF